MPKVSLGPEKASGSIPDSDFFCCSNALFYYSFTSLHSSYQDLSICEENVEKNQAIPKLLIAKVGVCLWKIIFSWSLGDSTVETFSFLFFAFFCKQTSDRSTVHSPQSTADLQKDSCGFWRRGVEADEFLLLHHASHTSHLSSRSISICVKESMYVRISNQLPLVHLMQIAIFRYYGLVQVNSINYAS